MKSLKGYLAVVLLTLFAVITVPKEFLHDCSHVRTQTIDLDLQKVEVTEGDCPICEYTFSSPFQFKAYTPGEPLQFSFSYTTWEQRAAAYASIDLPGLRGPPCC